MIMSLCPRKLGVWTFAHRPPRLRPCCGRCRQLDDGEARLKRALAIAVSFSVGDFTPLLTPRVLVDREPRSKSAPSHLPVPGASAPINNIQLHNG